MKKNTPLIEVKNLTMNFGNEKTSIPAIQNINLKIEKGEFVCVLGPSGCGKSTLLRILAGYQKPTSGEVNFQNHPINGPDWHRGVVFQSSTLYPWLTVKGNVEFGPKMRGLKSTEIDKVSHHFLTQIDLIDDANKAVFELSGGMKQRVALARTLANQPEMILMDEPLGALDALTRLNMQTLIRKLWKENENTVLMITHDVDEALALGTRIVVMSKKPGMILKEFKVDYTHLAYRTPNNRVPINDAYLKMKDEILDLINWNMNN
ncbi:ABC transporter ATP-binding protein [Amphibacillus sp. Q70]|uniref:ABC transporter ATP-binding protein n=1 Tax=Amphibacillus sp. Q70 TaxID=3453416 RepID=UPI003F84BFAD